MRMLEQLKPRTCIRFKHNIKCNLKIIVSLLSYAYVMYLCVCVWQTNYLSNIPSMAAPIYIFQNVEDIHLFDCNILNEYSFHFKNI